MNIKEHITSVEDFLYWLESKTNYEIGEDIQSDYGDGESYFHSVDTDSLMKQYKESFE